MKTVEVYPKSVEQAESVMADIVISPVPKKKENSIAEYLAYVERVSGANGWSDEQTAKILPGLLEVGSTDLNDLDASTLKSFKLIKEALAPKSEVSREVHVQKFIFMAMEANESVEEWLGRCKKVVQECYPSFAKANRSVLTRDRFVHGLRKHLQTAVFNQKNGKLEEAVEAAAMAESVSRTLSWRKKTVSGEDVKSGAKVEMNKKTDKKTVVCFNCREPGHFKSSCPNGSSTKTQSRSGLREVKSVQREQMDRPTMVGAVNGLSLIHI